MTLAEIRAYIQCLDDDCPDGFGTIMVDRQKIIALLNRLATLEAAVGRLPVMELNSMEVDRLMRVLKREGYPLTADALADLLKLVQGTKNENR